MKLARALLVASLVAATVLLTTACSSGDDVVLVPSSRALSCKVTAGENICGRTFDVAEEDRANVIAFLQIAAMGAGEAHELVERVIAVCDAIGRDVGVSGVSIPEADPLTKKRAQCLAVGKAIGSFGSGTFVVTRETPTCTEASAPPCASTPDNPLPTRTRCNPPALSVQVNASDAGHADVMAASLRRHLPELAWVDLQVEQIAVLASALSGKRTHAVGGAWLCSTELARLVLAMSDDVKIAIELRQLVDGNLHPQ